MQTEDGSLVANCLDGDPIAFGLLIDKYKASIYAIAYSRLDDFQDGGNVTQEVFITAYHKLSTLECWDSFAKWLYSITIYPEAVQQRIVRGRELIRKNILIHC